MIILYKDPDGKNLQVTMTTIQRHNRSDSDAKSGSTITRRKLDLESSQLVEKVAFLERKLTENELTMDKMKKELEVLQNVCPWFVANITIFNALSHSHCCYPSYHYA